MFNLLFMSGEDQSKFLEDYLAVKKEAKKPQISKEEKKKRKRKRLSQSIPLSTFITSLHVSSNDDKEMNRR